MVLTFDSVDEVSRCDRHLFESYRAVVSCDVANCANQGGFYF